MIKKAVSIILTGILCLSMVSCAAPGNDPAESLQLTVLRKLPRRTMEVRTPFSPLQCSGCAAECSRKPSRSLPELSAITGKMSAARKLTGIW